MKKDNSVTKPNVRRYLTDDHDKGRRGEIIISQLVTKNKRQCQAVIELLEAFDLSIAHYEKYAI